MLALAVRPRTGGSQDGWFSVQVGDTGRRAGRSADSDDDADQPPVLIVEDA
jgi:hypothetical protein